MAAPRSMQGFGPCRKNKRFKNAGSIQTNKKTYRKKRGSRKLAWSTHCFWRGDISTRRILSILGGKDFSTSFITRRKIWGLNSLCKFASYKKTGKRSYGLQSTENQHIICWSAKIKLLFETLPQFRWTNSNFCISQQNYPCCWIWLDQGNEVMP